MKTTKLTKVTHQVEEIEVPVPYFVKHSFCSYAVIYDEHTAISVTFSKVANSGIQVMRPEQIMKENPRQITRSEFRNFFEAAIEDIQFTLQTKGKSTKKSKIMKTKDWINLVCLLFASAVALVSYWKWQTLGIEKYVIPMVAMSIMFILTIALWILERLNEKQ